MKLTADQIVDRALADFDILACQDLIGGSSYREIKASKKRCIWGAVFEVIYAVSGGNQKYDVEPFPCPGSVEESLRKLQLELGLEPYPLTSAYAALIMPPMNYNDNKEHGAAQAEMRFSLRRILDGKTVGIDEPVQDIRLAA